MARSLRADPIELAHRNWVERHWDKAAGGMAIVTSVMRVQQIFANQVEGVLRPFDLTFARYEVLMLLDFSRSGQLPLGKIGERLQVHPASVTNAVDRLESDGLVTRTPNPSDGRSTLASISRSGRERAASASAALNDQVFAAGALTASEQHEAFRLLAIIRHAAGDFT
jgi:DNA-binding MarR family transcriptional regulator